MNAALVALAALAVVVVGSGVLLVVGSGQRVAVAVVVAVLLALAGWIIGVRRPVLAVVAVLVVGASVLAGGGEERSTVASAAGAQALSTAQRGGVAIRLRGVEVGERKRKIAAAPAGATCRGVTLGGVSGDQRMDLHVRACWDDEDRPVRLTAEHRQFRSGAYGRSRSIPSWFDMGTGRARVSAPSYGEDAADLARSEPGRVPFRPFDERARPVDDGRSDDDTLVARVSEDGRSVQVVATWVVQDPLYPGERPELTGLPLGSLVGRGRVVFRAHAELGRFSVAAGNFTRSTASGETTVGRGMPDESVAGSGPAGISSAGA